MHIDRIRCTYGIRERSGVALIAELVVGYKLYKACLGWIAVFLKMSTREIDRPF